MTFSRPNRLLSVVLALSCTAMMACSGGPGMDGNDGNPNNPNDRNNPNDPADPNNPSDPNDPADPNDPSDDVDPIDPIDVIDAEIPVGDGDGDVTEPPEGALVVTDEELAELAETGDLIAHEELTDEEQAAREAAREAQVQADRDLITFALSSNPARRDRLLAEPQGELQPDGTRKMTRANGEEVILHGHETQIASAANALRRFASQENQAKLFAALLPLAPESCREGLPSEEEAMGLDATVLKAHNDGLNACWTTWREENGAPTPDEPSELPANYPGDASGYEGAPLGGGEDGAGECGDTTISSVRNDPHRWALSPVKNQAGRGTCAAFAAVSALEYSVARRMHRYVNFSEQHVYSYGKYTLNGDHYGDGLNTLDFLEDLDDDNYHFEFEATWGYNQSPNRMDLDTFYAGSCLGYDGEACSDTAHQMQDVYNNGQLSWWRPSNGTDTDYEVAEVIEIGDLEDGNVTQVRALLDAGWGIVLSLDVGESFDAGTFTLGGEIDGGHAVHLVGIADGIYPNYEPRVVIKNSWGCSWGNQGYDVVPMDYIEEYFRSAIAIRARRDGQNSAPTPEILTPADGNSINFGGILNSHTFTGQATDLEDAECCALEWASNLDGYMGTGPSIAHQFVNPGTHTITLTARDSDGAVGQTTIQVHLVNNPPTVDLVEPANNEEFVVGEAVTFDGESADASEPLGIPCANYSWSSSNPIDELPASGCDINVAFETVGARTITMSVTDSDGATASTSVTVVIVEPEPEDLPTITITSPAADGLLFNPNEPMPLTRSYTSQAGGFIGTGWRVIYKGQTYTINPGGIFSNWVPSDTLGGDCGSQALTIEAWITDANGSATATRNVFLSYGPC